MTKNVYRIDRTRLQRSFVGTHTLANPTAESWQECGHYYRGVEISVDEIYEKDDLGREAATIDGYDDLGYLVTGSGEPAQNTAEAINFYQNVFRGTRNFAVLIGNKLWLFRLVRNGQKWIDNRISIKSAVHYSGFLKGKFDLSGYVQSWEMITVDPASVKIQSGRLTWTTIDQSYPAQPIQIGQ